jgi:hypothetical protein
MDFDEFELNIIAAIDGCTGSVKNCAQNSIRHLNKGWDLREMDTEMAVFRGITAEEEAAAAIFYTLKNHKYKNAKKISFKDHSHKLGLYPFLRGIAQFLHETLGNETSPVDKYSLAIIDVKNRKAVELQLNLHQINKTGRPIPPLNFSIKDYITGEPISFEKNFQNLIVDKNHKDSQKYIHHIASLRNKLLYATSSGKPKVKGNINNYLFAQKKKVFNYLIILLMIDPWEKAEGSSIFVQQALNAYLLLLQKIESSELGN